MRVGAHAAIGLATPRGVRSRSGFSWKSALWEALNIVVLHRIRYLLNTPLDLDNLAKALGQQVDYKVS